MALEVDATEISVVVPVFNEDAIIRSSLAVIAAQLEKTEPSYEIVVVDDGSTDSTSDQLLLAATDNPKIRIVSFTRNFGKEAAMQAGMDAARGNAVIFMDSDLQHPPEVIPEMVSLWRSGFEVVNGVKNERGAESALRRFASETFNHIAARSVGADLAGASDFKLIDRVVVEALQELPERNRFFRGLVAWLGFRETAVRFDVAERAGGRGKWNGRGLLIYATRNLMAFSTWPLRVMSLAGFATVAFGLVLGVQTLVVYLSGRAVSGFTTVIVLLVIFSGVIITSLGVIALYLAMIYEEQKRRPLYLAKRAKAKAKRDGR